MIRSAIDFLARLRCGPLLFIALGCLLLEEQFPFSNFPMYSSFTRSTFYVHLANGDGQPIATLPSTEMHTSTLKKIYESELRKETQRLGKSQKALTPEEKRPVGELVLARVTEAARARGQSDQFATGLRLYEVSIGLTGGRFDKQTLLIAEAR